MTPKKEKNLQPYETDASMIQGNCLEVLFPTSSEEVAKLVRQNSNITIRGGGSGLVGGCVPNGGIVLDLSKMNKILELDAGKGIVEVEAGIILGELNSKLDKHELEFPVKPSSHEICTLGGMIATNAVGNRAVKYGKTSDWVLELEVVNGKGEILKIKKNELSDFTGMEGITGIITKAKLKLALKKKRSASLYSFSDINMVVENVIKFKLRNDVSEIEFLDKMSSGILGLPEGYYLIVEFESQDGKLKGEEYNVLMDKRDSLYPLLAKLGYVRIEDPKIMLNRFFELANFLEEEKVPFFGHLGVGVIHPVFRQGEEGKISKMIDFVKKLHGQVSGEHGIGMRKKEFVDVNDRKLIVLVKKRQDPESKLNCGKVIDFQVNEMSERAKERIEQAEKIIAEQNQEVITEQQIAEEISEEIKQEEMSGDESN